MNTPKINDGGPAFPVLEYSRSASGDLLPEPIILHGMSLRDWFAGMAMQGIISACGDHLGSVRYIEHDIARAAYITSDAMIAERSKNADPA